MVLTVVSRSCLGLLGVVGGSGEYVWVSFLLFLSWTEAQSQEEKKDAKMEEKNGEKTEERKDEKTEKEQPEAKEDKDKEEEEDYDDNSFDDNMSVPSEESIQEESDLGGGSPSHDDSV